MIATLLTPIPKIYPSSLTFSFGDYNPASYNSQCWRFQQLSQGVRGPPLHPSYAAIGEQNENEHAATLTAPFQAELPFKRDLGNNTVLSGRADFVLADSIDECKASFTENKGKPKDEHLAQLTCYLLEFQLTRGRLVYGYYKQRSNGTFKRESVTTFNVELDGDALLVNGSDTGFKASELVNTIVQLTKYLNSDLPAPRPSTATSFFSPCKYCPVKDLCDRIEGEGLTISETRAEAAQLIQSKQGPTPKPTKVKE